MTSDSREREAKSIIHSAPALSSWSPGNLTQFASLSRHVPAILCSRGRFSPHIGCADAATPAATTDFLLHRAGVLPQEILQRPVGEGNIVGPEKNGDDKSMNIIQLGQGIPLPGRAAIGSEIFE